VIPLNPRREGILLDSQPLWLSALARLCQEVGIDVIGSGTSAEEALELLDARAPDLFITELRLYGGQNAIRCIETARKRAPSLRVLVISDLDDSRSVDEALAAGADAFVSKSANREDIGSAIRHVLLPSLVIGPRYGRSTLGSPPAGRAAVRVELTKRETEILGLVSQGYSNSRVAGSLWVTEQTVKFHLSNVYRKLGVANRTEATRWALEHSAERVVAGGAR
jgi:DNA-binding NarL/FixJ family response regulator